VGIFRIFLGALICAFYLALYPNWERFYAADGVVSLNLFPNPLDGWALFHWTEPNLPIRAYWWLGMAAALLFTLGWQTRLCTVVLFVMESSLLNRSLPAMNGEDVAFRMMLFYGMFAPLGHRLSLDSFLKRRKGDESRRPLPAIWAVRALQINFALIYAISLPYKLADDVVWWNGEAVYWIIANPTWGRWPWPGFFYGLDELLSKLMTFGTLLVEGAFVVLVWFDRFRLHLIAAAALLHIGIAFLLSGATFFTLAMACGLWVFVPGEEAKNWGQWLSARCLETAAAWRRR
jgi:hypothetical protein